MSDEYKSGIEGVIFFQNGLGLGVCTSVLSPHSCSFFLVRVIASVSIVSISLDVILALWSPVLQFKLPALLFVCV